MNNKKIIAASLVCVLLVSSGCARRIGGNQYTSNAVGEASFSYQGVILSVRKVEVNEAERVADNGTGMAVGGIAGGLGGSMIGKGNGKLAGIAGGALLGGLAGMFAENELGRQEAVEYSVKLSNGNILTVVQADQVALPVGQRVIVSVPSGPKGRSYVIADNSGTPMEVQQMQTPHGKGSSIIINTNVRN